jgi:Arc/MetJ family transcription regulator
MDLPKLNPREVRAVREPSGRSKALGEDGIDYDTELTPEQMRRLNLDDNYDALGQLFFQALRESGVDLSKWRQPIQTTPNRRRNISISEMLRL